MPFWPFWQPSSNKLAIFVISCVVLSMLFVENKFFFFFLLRGLQIIVNSMHKYQPRLHVVYVETGLHHREGRPMSANFKTFTFPLTHFIVVTAYQNHRVD